MMNCMSKWAGAALVLCLTTGPAAATALLDQESSGTSDAGAFLEDVSGVLGTNAYQVQTFTVGMNGTLDSFEVMLGRVGAATGSVDFEIRNVVGGYADFSTGPLASVTVNFDLPTGEGYATGDVSAFGIDVTAGQMLALVGVTGTVNIPLAPADDQYVNWLISQADPYAQGQYYAYQFSDLTTPILNEASYDTLFRTYVTPGSAAAPVPAPTTVLLIAPALLGLMIGRQRRQ